MKKALVFGGGGSKGAYEIGVWKALDELGMHFDCVCGTSIGACIAAMYVQKQYDEVVKLWSNLHAEDIITNGINLDFDFDLLLAQKEKYKKFFHSYIHNGIDVSPFKKMIEEMYDEQAFFDSEIDFACMCVNFTKRKAQPIFKKDLTKTNVVDYLLASSSCFPAFPMHEIDGDLYIDGGYADNVPISLAKSLGAQEIVAVDLKYRGNKRRKNKNNIIYIQPHVSLGSFLMFEQERIQRNEQLGYYDTLKAFNVYKGTLYTFFNDENFMQFNLRCEKLMFDLKEDVFQVMKAYERNEYIFINLLEQIAMDFGIDDLHVYTLEQFLMEVLKQVKNVYQEDKVDFVYIKEKLRNIANAHKKEAILLMIELFIDYDELITISKVLKDTYVKAYLLHELYKKRVMLID